MEVKVEIQVDRQRLLVTGDVDLSTSTQLREALNRLTQEKTMRIEVNLAGVAYMDSSGIATLVECLQQTNSYNGKLVLTGMTEAVRSVFELANLLPVFTVE